MPFPEITINKDMPDSVGYYCVDDNIIHIGTPHIRFDSYFGHVRVEMSEDNWINVLSHEICHWVQFSYSDIEKIREKMLKYRNHKVKDIWERAMPKEYYSEATPLMVMERDYGVR